jgi:pimeloyl-ACP methyl ester carboxylesterase
LAKYVLVHGAWHGGWCWEKVVPLLHKAGHEAVVIDLPGHDAETAHIPISNITLQSYVDRVCEALDASEEPLILVGHSMGGIVITQAAELRPEKIQVLVYLSAFLLKNGEYMRQVASANKDSLLQQNLIHGQDYVSIKKEFIPEIFYGHCSEQDTVRALSRLIEKQPSVPLFAPLRTTLENYGRVPRYYIECLQDLAIPIAAQQRMYTETPCEKIFTLDTDHSSFYSTPKELVSCLELCTVGR